MDATNMIRSAGAFLEIIFKVNLRMTCRTPGTCSQFPSITVCCDAGKIYFYLISSKAQKLEKTSNSTNLGGSRCLVNKEEIGPEFE